MVMPFIQDPIIIQKACEMKHGGWFISEISRKLSDETGYLIPPVELWRMFITQAGKSHMEGE